MSSTSPTTTSTSTNTSTSESSGASPSTRYGGFVPSGSGFYKNLFYILIGLLGVFILASFVSWYRGRRRRAAFIQEARRLNLLIPGMPGYAAERERLILSVKGVNASTEPPEVWDVVDGRARRAHGGKMGEMGWGGSSGLNPISLTPLMNGTHKHVTPLPISTLRRFPNNLAFRAPEPKKGASLVLAEWDALARRRGEGTGYPPPLPPPLASDPADRAERGESAMRTREGQGEKAEVQMGVLIRMPVPVRQGRGDRRRTEEEEEESAVQDEWMGVELGVEVVEIDLDRPV